LRSSRSRKSPLQPPHDFQACPENRESPMASVGWSVGLSGRPNSISRRISVIQRGQRSNFCPVSVRREHRPSEVGWRHEPPKRVSLTSSDHLWYQNHMRPPRKNGTKKRLGRPGRPATGQGIQIGTRWPESTVSAIEAWAAEQEDEPGRSEAIRRLVSLGLK